MAINYNYGLNPNMGNFVSSYLRGTGMQANAYAEEEKAKQKAQAQQATAFTKMIGDIAMSYGKVKKAEQDTAMSDYKDAYKEEKARLTDSRNQYAPGSESWNTQNDALFALNKEYKTNLANYKKSGNWNKDASLLEFGSADPKFTGLSDEAQGQISKNDQLIADLQAQKTNLEKDEFKEQEFFKRREGILKKREEGRLQKIREERKDIDDSEKYWGEYAMQEGEKERTRLLKDAPEDVFATPFGQEANKKLSEQFRKKFETVNTMGKEFVKDRRESLMEEASKQGTRSWQEQKDLSEQKKNVEGGFGTAKKSIDLQIADLQKKNKGLIAEGEKNLEGYDFDPRTGEPLKRSDLKFQEQRRYQEEKQKGVLRGQALGMMLSAGVDVSNMDTSGTPYSMMNEEQLQAVQNNSMEPELRQIGRDALKFGTALSADNAKHVSVAREFGMTIPEFNKHVKVAYETQTMSRIRNAGGNYEALKSIKEEINNKGADFLKGTTLSGGMIDRAIEDSKIAHQKTMYSNMNQVLSLGDSGTATRWLEVNKGRIAQYEKDGVLPQGFANASKSLVDTKIKAQGEALNLKDQQRKLNLLQDLLQQGTTSKTGMTPQLKSQIDSLSQDLGYKSDDLLEDVNEQNKLDRQSKQLSQQVKLLDFSEKMRRNLYEQEYGTGPSITGARVTEDGRVGFNYRKTNDGKIDVKDAMKKFINRYFSETGMT